MATARGDIKLTVDQRALQTVVAAIKKEADGKQLRSALYRELRTVLQPAAQEAKSAILSAPTLGTGRGDMRAAIAAHVKVSVRSTGRTTGVSVGAPKGPYPRGFANAPRRFDANSFRHPVFGHPDRWTAQNGAPGWFSRIRVNKPQYVEAVEKTLTEMAERIAARTTTEGKS